MSPQAPPSTPIQTQPSSRPNETRGLQKIVWFGIIVLAGTAGGWVASFYFFDSGFWFGFGSSLGPNATPAQVGAALAPLFTNIAYFAAAGLVLELIAVVVLWSGLRDLAKVDHGRFSTPAILSLLLIAGLALVGVGVFPLLNGIPSLISQAPIASNAMPSQAFFSSLGSLGGYLALLGVGGILALIGVIGGLIIGLWRVGDKYDQTIIKVGGIFFIVPLLNIVAPVLILVGAWEAKNRITRP